MQPTPCQSHCGALWTALLLFSVFGFSTVSLGYGASTMTLLLVMIVPFATFAVAAPGRMPLGKELMWAIRELETLAAMALFKLLGKTEMVTKLSQAQRAHLKAQYGIGRKKGSATTHDDFVRLNMGREVANWGALWITGVGLALPLGSDTLSYGPAFFAPFIFVLDAMLLWVISRVFLGRIAHRLWESNRLLRANNLVGAGFCALWTVLSGAILGAVGGLVLGQVLGVASVMETLWVFPQATLFEAAQQSVLTFAFLVFAPGAIAGSVLGGTLALSFTSLKTGA